MHYYIFDVMVLAGRDLTGDTLDARRQLLEQTVVPTLNEPVRYTGARSAARTRNGFTPALRQQLFTRLRPLETSECPFANLPEAKSGRWGQGLTKAKMAECRWVNPILVGRFEFVEWTPDNHFGTRRSSASEMTRLRVTSGASNYIVGAFEQPSTNSRLTSFCSLVEE